MSGDAHVRFCERLGVRFPRATHLIMSWITRISDGISRCGEVRGKDDWSRRTHAVCRHCQWNRLGDSRRSRGAVYFTCLASDAELSHASTSDNLGQVATTSAVSLVKITQSPAFRRNA